MDMMRKMFDENNPQWVQFFKLVTIVAFWCWIAFGVFALLDNWQWGYVFDIEIFDTYFLGGVFLLLCSAVVGFAQLAANMLIIQFIGNVKAIREKLETM